MKQGLTRSSLRLKFVKKTNMSNPVESLGHVKCYSSSSQRPTKSSSNSIRYNCQTICSCSRRPETILEIRKKATFHGVIKRLMKVFINGFCVNLCYVFSYFPPEGVDCSSKCKTLAIHKNFCSVHFIIYLETYNGYQMYFLGFV